MFCIDTFPCICLEMAVNLPLAELIWSMFKTRNVIPWYCTGLWAEFPSYGFDNPNRFGSITTEHLINRTAFINKIPQFLEGESLETPIIPWWNPHVSPLSVCRAPGTPRATRPPRSWNPWAARGPSVPAAATSHRDHGPTSSRWAAEMIYL